MPLLEASQALPNGAIGGASDDGGDGRADASGRWGVAQDHLDLRAAAPGRGEKRTDPALFTSDSPTERQAMSRPGSSATSSASHSTGTPAGPRVTHRDRVRSSGVTDSRCGMSSGRRARSRHSAYISSGDRITVMVRSTCMPRPPESVGMSGRRLAGFHGPRGLVSTHAVAPNQRHCGDSEEQRTGGTSDRLIGHRRPPRKNCATARARGGPVARRSRAREPAVFSDRCGDWHAQRGAVDDGLGR